MHSKREQRQVEHIDYLKRQLLLVKTNMRESVAMFVLIGGLIYWGTEILSVALAIGWIGAAIRGVAADLKRTYLLTEFNRALCEYDGDLDELNRRLGNVNKVEDPSSMSFWRRWF